MAQLGISSRTCLYTGSMAARIMFVRQLAFVVALPGLLWSSNALIQAMPANYPSTLPTADIMNHDFKFIDTMVPGNIEIDCEWNEGAHES